MDYLRPSTEKFVDDLDLPRTVAAKRVVGDVRSADERRLLGDYRVPPDAVPIAPPGSSLQRESMVSSIPGGPAKPRNTLRGNQHAPFQELRITGRSWEERERKRLPGTEESFAKPSSLAEKPFDLHSDGNYERARKKARSGIPFGHTYQSEHNRRDEDDEDEDIVPIARRTSRKVSNTASTVGQRSADVGGTMRMASTTAIPEYQRVNQLMNPSRGFKRAKVVYPSARSPTSVGRTQPLHLMGSSPTAPLEIDSDISSGRSKPEAIAEPRYLGTANRSLSTKSSVIGTNHRSSAASSGLMSQPTVSGAQRLRRSSLVPVEMDIEYLSPIKRSSAEESIRSRSLFGIKSGRADLEWVSTIKSRRRRSPPAQEISSYPTKTAQSRSESPSEIVISDWQPVRTSREDIKGTKFTSSGKKDSEKLPLIGSNNRDEDDQIVDSDPSPEDILNGLGSAIKASHRRGANTEANSEVQNAHHSTSSRRDPGSPDSTDNILKNRLDNYAKSIWNLDADAQRISRNKTRRLTIQHGNRGTHSSEALRVISRESQSPILVTSESRTSSARKLGDYILSPVKPSKFYGRNYSTRSKTTPRHSDTNMRNKEHTPPLELEKYSQVHGLGDPWDGPLIFPSEGQRKATVEQDDLRRLDEGEFLNDNIIFFYLRYLEHQLEARSQETSKQIYIFNTFFYERLTRKGKKGLDYEAVQKWTSKVDIFNFDFVVVPINESAHWYIAIICNLPKLAETMDDQDNVTDIIDNAGQEEVPNNTSSPAMDSDVPIYEDRMDTDQPNDDIIDLSADHLQVRLGSSLKLVNTEQQDHVTAQLTGLFKAREDVEEWPHSNEGRSPKEPHFAVDLSSQPSSAECEQVAGNPHEGLSEGQNSRPRQTRLAGRGKRKSKSFTPVQRKYETDKPIIITLDSLGLPHSATTRNLKEYLIKEGEAKRGLQIDKADIAGMTAKQIPQQDNYCDCGLFLLGYMEKFLQNPHQLIEKILQREVDEIKDWPNMKPSNMRDEIREIIQTLHGHQVRERREAKKQMAKRKKNKQQDIEASMPDQVPSPQLDIARESPQVIINSIKQLGNVRDATHEEESLEIEDSEPERAKERQCHVNIKPQDHDSLVPMESEPVRRENIFSAGQSSHSTIRENGSRNSEQSGAEYMPAKSTAQHPPFSMTSAPEIEVVIDNSSQSY